MKTRAAVAWKAGAPLDIETIDIEGPKAGEVLVEIKATGICHTDAYTLSGADPEGLFPAILGHEGAGIVRDVGAGVTTLKAGDHVIPLYTPECRQCKTCLSRRSNLCTAIRATQGKGVMPDGTSRFRCDGDAVFHYMGCSTFANFTVLPEIALAKVREDAPFDKICYIGCGVTTGVGAVINTAKVWPGANVAVFGLGGIGLNVIQGARMVGADKIVGIDTNPAKKAMAEKFGMTHFVNPDEVGRDKVVQAVVDLTGGGADFSFECIGNVQTMRQALECCHRGWGESIIIGVAGAGRVGDDVAHVLNAVNRLFQGNQRRLDQDVGAGPLDLEVQRAAAVDVGEPDRRVGAQGAGVRRAAHDLAVGAVDRQLGRQQADAAGLDLDRQAFQ